LRYKITFKQTKNRKEEAVRGEKYSVADMHGRTGYDTWMKHSYLTSLSNKQKRNENTHLPRQYITHDHVMRNMLVHSPSAVRIHFTVHT